jgi:hypothetical protein
LGAFLNGMMTQARIANDPEILRELESQAFDLIEPTRSPIPA